MNIEKTHLKIKFNLLFLWVIIILSQVLKSSYSLVYFPIFFSLLAVICIFIFQKGFFIKGTDFFSLQIWIFYFLILYVASVSFIYGSLSDFLKAFPRMIIMPVTLIIFINLITKKDEILKIINLLIIFSIIASISLIYQVYFGPLEFLVDSSSRFGLERYPSTFGSLTIYSAVVGIITLLVLRLEINFFFRLLIIILFLLSSFLTLAKAAIVNIILVTFFSLFFLKIRYKFYFISLTFLSLSLIYFLFPKLALYINTSIEIIGISSDGIDTVSSGSLYQQFLKRFFYSIDYLLQFETNKLFFGFGLIGGQGVFGLPYSFTGTTHNQFMDLYLIGGIFLFLNVVFITFCLMLELYKMKKKDYLAETFFFCNLIGIINMFFFNGFIYQPVTSFVFWLSIVYVLMFRKNFYEKSL